MCKALAEFLFDDENAIVRLDMNPRLYVAQRRGGSSTWGFYHDKKPSIQN